MSVSCRMPDAEPISAEKSSISAYGREKQFSTAIASDAQEADAGTDSNASGLRNDGIAEDLADDPVHESRDGDKRNKIEATAR